MKAHLVGSGLASLAAAAYLIKDGGFLANNVRIYEAAGSLGGAMAMSGGAEKGYVLPTGRVFERNYRCAFELFSLVPSISDPQRSITDEILEFNESYGYDDRARIIDREGKVVRSEHFGLSVRNRMDLLKLALTPEEFLDGRAISEFYFHPRTTHLLDLLRGLLLHRILDPLDHAHERATAAQRHRVQAVYVPVPAHPPRVVDDEDGPEDAVQSI